MNLVIYRIVPAIILIQLFSSIYVITQICRENIEFNDTKSKTLLASHVFYGTLLSNNFTHESIKPETLAATFKLNASLKNDFSCNCELPYFPTVVGVQLNFKTVNKSLVWLKSDVVKARQWKLCLTKLKINQEYIIFLNGAKKYMEKNYFLYYMSSLPVPLNGKNLRNVKLFSCKNCGKKSKAELSPKKLLLERTAKEFNLFCQFKGRPKPRITWFKDKKLLEENERTTFIQNKSMIILKVNSDDLFEETGAYYCKASNVMSTSFSHEAMVYFKKLHQNKILPCFEHEKLYCRNNGTCYKDIRQLGLKCVCEEGFYGDRCQVRGNRFEDYKFIMNKSSVEYVAIVIIFVIIILAIVIIMTFSICFYRNNQLIKNVNALREINNLKKISTQNDLNPRDFNQKNFEKIDLTKNKKLNIPGESQLQCRKNTSIHKFQKAPKNNNSNLNESKYLRVSMNDSYKDQSPSKLTYQIKTIDPIPISSTNLKTISSVSLNDSYKSQSPFKLTYQIKTIEPVPISSSNHNNFCSASNHLNVNKLSKKNTNMNPFIKNITSSPYDFFPSKTITSNMQLYSQNSHSNNDFLNVNSVKNTQIVNSSLEEKDFMESLTKYKTVEGIKNYQEFKNNKWNNNNVQNSVSNYLLKKTKDETHIGIKNSNLNQRPENLKNQKIIFYYETEPIHKQFNGHLMNGILLNQNNILKSEFNIPKNEEKLRQDLDAILDDLKPFN